MDFSSDITLLGFGSTAPPPVLELVASLSSNEKSIACVRSQNIEYELLKSPYRTFLNSCVTNGDKVIIYNVPNSLSEYLSAISEVNAVRSACYNNSHVVPYDSTKAAFLIGSPSEIADGLTAKNAGTIKLMNITTLGAIAKLDEAATKHIVKSKDVVLLVGSGGREHALAVSLANSPLVGRVICLPGNGGTSSDSPKIVNATNDKGEPIGDCKNETVVELVKRLKVDMVVVGPEQPLVDGLVNCLAVECAGVRVFGPSREAAELEASKVRKLIGLLDTDCYFRLWLDVFIDCL